MRIYRTAEKSAVFSKLRILYYKQISNKIFWEKGGIEIIARLGGEANMETREELIKLYEKFRTENSLEFETTEFEKIEKDLYSPRKGIATDEFVEFKLWSKGFRTRQQCFADFVEKVLPLDKYKKILEVGAGRNPRLSKLLSEKGYEMTAMDPRLENKLIQGNLEESEIRWEIIWKKTTGEATVIRCIKGEFILGEADISEYDAVIGQEPCDATEPMVKACVEQGKDFVISLCGVPHKYMNGEAPKDAYEWFDYLENIGGDKCIRVAPDIIPGYITNVLIGKVGGF